MAAEAKSSLIKRLFRWVKKKCVLIGAFVVGLSVLLVNIDQLSRRRGNDNGLEAVERAATRNPADRDTAERQAPPTDTVPATQAPSHVDAGTGRGDKARQRRTASPEDAQLRQADRATNKGDAPSITVTDSPCAVTGSNITANTSCMER